MSQVTTPQILSYAGYWLRQGWQQRDFHRWLTCLLLCLPLLAIGCTARQRPEEATLLLAEALPSSWTALDNVKEVNIDGDSPPEYLLLFTYDTTSKPSRNLFAMQQNEPHGPIGAVIYDAHVITATISVDRVSPDRPTNALVPYAILPSYQHGAGQGFIAAPEQWETVDAYSVNYHTLSSAVSTPETATADTIILLGGETYVTFVWWENRTEGYGVTQLYAPGGFERELYETFDWRTWRNDPQPILSIIARHPLHDRNLICRRFQYDLYNDGGSPTVTQAILFQKSDLGLHFCDGTPAHPFYPEGVVLAYLLEGKVDLLDTSVIPISLDTQPNQPPWLPLLIQNHGRLRVDDLASYRSLNTNNGPPFISLQPGTIGVCAIVTIQPATGSTLTPPQQQGLLFVLRHQPATSPPSTPDLFFIQTVEMIAAPAGSGVVNCEQQLGG